MLLSLGTIRLSDTQIYSSPVLQSATLPMLVGQLENAFRYSSTGRLAGMRAPEGSLPTTTGPFIVPARSGESVRLRPFPLAQSKYVCNVLLHRRCGDCSRSDALLTCIYRAGLSRRAGRIPFFKGLARHAEQTACTHGALALRTHGAHFRLQTHPSWGRSNRRATE